MSNQHTPISKALRRVNGLAGLDDRQMEGLAEQLRMHHAEPGTCVMELGSEDPHLLFLIDGELELVAADGASRIIKHTDSACQDGPVSRLRPSHYRIVATRQVSYLLVEQTLLDSFAEQAPESEMLVEETYMVDEPNELIDPSATHPLMFDLFDDLNHGRILVPSDPEIAVRVGRALSALDTGTRQLADRLSVCPALTLKAMRSVMSSEDGQAPVRNALQIIERLGPERIYGLTVNCVLRDSLRTSSVLVRERMQSWWCNTMRVSAVCAILARANDHLDPDFAALIGLFHTIAEPVMLGYADQHDDLNDASALDNVLYDNRAEVGRILLTLWNMPREMVEAASHCNHWGYEHSGPTDYTDIVLAAQWHAATGAEPDARMPRLQDITALKRLGPPSEETSAKIIEAVKTAVEHTDRLLAD